MFCTTTTPFSLGDIVSVLSIPVNRIEMAWRALLPYFGTQVSFGPCRKETSPNFFDVIAINVLAEILTRSQDLERAVFFAIGIADEVAVCLDGSDISEVFGDQQREEICESLGDLLSQDPMYSVDSALLNRRNRILESVFEVFDSIETKLSQTNLNPIYFYNIGRQEMCETDLPPEAPSFIT